MAARGRAAQWSAAEYSRLAAIKFGPRCAAAFQRPMRRPNLREPHDAASNLRPLFCDNAPDPCGLDLHVARRISFITGHKISPRDLAVPGALARLSPPAVSNPSDNVKNLFEMPVLLYALALYLFVTSQVDAAYVYAGWCFVAFRALHSAVHCTFNLVMLRFYLYLISTVVLWFIALRAASAHFGGL
jgi:hypothetical protein